MDKWNDVECNNCGRTVCVLGATFVDSCHECREQNELNEDFGVQYFDEFNEIETKFFYNLDEMNTFIETTEYEIITSWNPTIQENTNEKSN